MAKTRGQRQGKLRDEQGSSEFNEKEALKIQEDTSEAVHQIQEMYEMPTAEDVSALNNVVSEFKYAIKRELDSRNSEAEIVSSALQEDAEESKEAIEQVRSNRNKIESLNHLNNQYDQSVVNKMISENRDAEGFQAELKQEAIQTREKLKNTVNSVSNRVHSLLS